MKRVRHTVSFSVGALRGIYDVERLWRVVKGRPRVLARIRALDCAGTQRRTGFCPERLKRCNVRWPIIVTPDLLVLDGRHRVVKLRGEGIEVVECQVVSVEELRRCRVSEARLCAGLREILKARRRR